MTVILTDFARITLQAIYDYYVEVAVHKVDESCRMHVPVIIGR